jgi:hypothetical protein
MPTSDNNVPSIDMQKWGDRAAMPDEVQAYARGPIPHSLHKPIAIRVEEFEIRMLYAAQQGECDPDAYNQFLLERFKHAGAPVEGIIKLRLAHGAVCKVKTNHLEPQTFFQYLWIPAEYAHAIAQAGVTH